MDFRVPHRSTDHGSSRPCSTPLLFDFTVSPNWATGCNRATNILSIKLSGLPSVWMHPLSSANRTQIMKFCFNNKTLQRMLNLISLPKLKHYVEETLELTLAAQKRCSQANTNPNVTLDHSWDFFGIPRQNFGNQIFVMAPRERVWGGGEIGPALWNVGP